MMIEATDGPAEQESVPTMRSVPVEDLGVGVMRLLRVTAGRTKGRLGDLLRGRLKRGAP